MKPQKNKFSFKRMLAYAIIPTAIFCGFNYNVLNTNLEKRLGSRVQAEVISPEQINNYLTQNQEDDTTEKIEKKKEKAETQKYNSRLENIVVEDKKQIESITKTKKIQEIKEVKNSKEDYALKSDVQKLAEVMYGESANQPRKTRRMVGKVVLNRIRKQGYPKTFDKVLYQYNGFSCTGADINNTWKQAIGKLPMNEYDKKVWKECIEDAKYVLSGKEIGIPHENDIIAYHDARVWYSKLIKDPKHKKYWMSLKPVGRFGGNLEFCIPKK